MPTISPSVLNFADSSSRAELPAIGWQRHYYVDDQPITTAFGRVLDDRMADLIDIAMAAYVADRLVKREPAPRSDPFRLDWYRSLSIRLGVRNPSLWRSREVSARLCDLLGWVTEDNWEFDFVKRSTQRRPAETQGFLFASPPQPPTTVALFSGGLDSLTGACELIDHDLRGDVVLVSASSSTRLRAVQGQLTRQLRSRGQLVSIRVPFNLTGATHPERHEISQRSRGFVFLALGAAAAVTAGSADLRLFENGIGAINLPYLECQIGTHSTRSAHPATITLFRDLLLALDVSLTIANPYFWLTKAEVCSRLPSQFRPLVSVTESCDGFPQRVHGRPRCGLCTACVLRAQALFAAGLSNFEDWDRYRHQPLTELADRTPESWPGRAMLYQVELLRWALARDEQWPSLVSAFPSLARLPSDLIAGPLGRQIARADLLSLFRRYVDEWDVVMRGQRQSTRAPLADKVVVGGTS